jgi:predicted N-acetyltransferase YhbS
MVGLSREFQKATIPIFIAQADNRIVEFACYDVVQMKKGVFGPMGTSSNYRQKGIGKALLYHCLSEMQRTGYAYAIIDNAGPIEFYETVCGAVVISKYFRG